MPWTKEARQASLEARKKKAALVKESANTEGNLKEAQAAQAPQPPTEPVKAEIVDAQK